MSAVVPDKRQAYFSDDDDDECLSFSHDVSTTGRDHSTDSKEQTEFRRRLLQKEERSVRNWRIIVFVVIVASALMVSFSVFRFAKESDQNSFELEYKSFTTSMIDLVVWELRYNFALCQQLSAGLTVTSIKTGQVFPNVTDDHFEISGGYVDGMSGISVAFYAPVIPVSKRAEWEAFAQQEGPQWLARSQEIRSQFYGHREPLVGTIQDHENDRRQLDDSSPIEVPPHIYRWQDGVRVPEPTLATTSTHSDEEEEEGYYLPVWQLSPASAPAVQTNLMSHPTLANLFESVRKTRQTVMSPTVFIGDMFDFAFDEEEKFKKDTPHSFVMTPVFETFEEDAPIVGVVLGMTETVNLINQLLPDTVKGSIVVVWEDTCGKKETFALNGPRAFYVGTTDAHNRQFDAHEVKRDNMELYAVVDEETMCPHTMKIYPSAEFRAGYDTQKPLVYTLLVTASFGLMLTLLAVYEWKVTRRQNKTMSNLLQSDKFIASLFPQNVRERIMGNEAGSKKGNMPAFKTLSGDGSDKDLLKDDDGLFCSKPIADFFPEATIMFADIAGFTAWSSMREPYQVFALLETLYGAFDEIAKRRRIFKVETVGDCYVAVAGLPHPRRDHAVAMVRFAHDCLGRMADWVSKLEYRLGPDTADLSLRIGLHSGAVTGGVLRGENARFQLFGDAMNTCARIESTGQPGRIHVSQETADLLMSFGKGSWVSPREQTVVAKGKGELQTYWVEVASARAASLGSSTEASSSGVEEIPVTPTVAVAGVEMVTQDERVLRLIAWNVDVLARLLRQIAASRQRQQPQSTRNIEVSRVEQSNLFGSHGRRTIEEVQEVIALPPMKKSSSEGNKANAKDIQLTETVLDQLKSYVSVVASMHRDNSFHSFEHASHVTMSVAKLMSRIVAPADLEHKSDDAALHDYTYGITSDPLTQFACVFSAIIHDLDHPGVPNGQLIKENSTVAKHYYNKSVAEQNSIDLAWTLLMDPQYEDLRGAIYHTEAEFRRFRQLVVNSVMATDIMDKDLKQLRNHRWEKAFAEGAVDQKEDQNAVNRKATVVIEHLIQASDVSHTMQHWHVYRKWNMRLFEECYKAYKEGRAEKDPSEGWYKGELGFFDFYIIPLAKKLKDCGVFGVSSDEYLNYATKNRMEWEVKGKEIVSQMIESVREK